MHDASVKSSEELVVGDKLMGTDCIPKEIAKIDKIKGRVLLIIPKTSESFYVLDDEEIVFRATNMDLITWREKERKASVRYLTPTGLKYRSTTVPSHDKDQTLKEAQRILDDECKTLANYMPYKDTCEVKASTYIKWPISWRNSYKITVGGLEFHSQLVSIEPYAIGYWLGDGDSDQSRFTSEDPEIVQYYTDYATRLGLMLKEVTNIKYALTTGTAFGGAGRNPFTNGLREYDLLGNKHIPIEYLHNSRQSRLDLLAGIIDSDGHLHNNGYDIILQSKRLIDGTVFLARSLGLSVPGGARPVKKTCTNAPGGPKEGDYFRISICGEGVNQIPCIIARKKAIRTTKKSATVFGFDIQDLGLQDFYRITLVTPSRVFLQDLTEIKL